MTTFERAVVGGAITGRIPGYSPEEDVAFITRAALYPALIFANPGYGRVMDSLVAYQAGWWIVDNYGTTTYVDDAELTYGADFEMVYHIGEYQIYKALNEGVALWYFANHGAQGYTWWNSKPFGPGILGTCYDDVAWRAYEWGGSPDNPETTGDGIVNPLDMITNEIW